MLLINKYTLPVRDVTTQQCIYIFFLSGILFSKNLWLSERFFPLVPIIEITAECSSWVNVIILIALVLFLITNIVFKSQEINHAILLLCIFFMIQDQMRWQPWVYMYILMLLPYSIHQYTAPFRINYLQIVIIGIYVWSGIHKLNPDFVNQHFKNLLYYLLHIQNKEFIESILPLGYLIPVIEVVTGLLLLLPFTRKIGVCLAIIIHSGILLYLSPLGINTNSVVYPWNVAMLFFVTLLFYGVKNKITIWPTSPPKFRFTTIAIAFICWILPTLNFFNLWDSYLSFSLYSEKFSDYYVAVEESELEKIDKRFSSYFVEVSGLKGGKIIDINKWSLLELNVPFYPESRIFKRVCKSFCTYGIEERKIVFLEIMYPSKSNSYATYTCKDLE